MKDKSQVNYKRKSVISYILSWTTPLVVLIVAFLVLRGQNVGGQSWIIMGLVALAPFIFCGFLSHVQINKHRKSNSGGTFIYVTTFPQYLLPFLVIYAIVLLLKLIDWFLYVLFDKHYISAFIQVIKDSIFGKPKNKYSSGGSGDIYMVVENGSERALSFCESKQDAYPDSPYYTKHYNRFIDDLGNYWRSYDDNQTFIKETNEQTSRGY